MSASGDPLYNTTNTTNTTSTGSTGSPVSAGGMLESVRLMVVDVLAFATQLVSDPLAAATEHKDLVILLLLMIATPLLFRLISSTAASAQAGADLRLAGTVEEDAEELEEEACKAPTIEAVWGDWCQQPCCIRRRGRRTIARPEAIDPLPVHRPNISVFLPSRICSDAVVAKVAAIMKAKCGMRILTNEALAPELDGIKEKRRQELLRMKVQEEVKVPRGIKNPDVKLLPMPNRFCFTCKKEITTKPSQCSACKAVIYCSADCAKKDWAQHKPMCSLLKTNVAHLEEWKLHDLPFDFYTAKSPLSSYNQVPFLTQQGYHNIGIFRRLCGCYNSTPCGEMASEYLAQIQATNPSAQEKFAMLGLPEEMYPLSKPLPSGFDVNTIVDWKTLFKARGWSLNNPAALVLDIPMTIWYLANRHVVKDLPASTVDKPRSVTIHLIGVEIEADYLGLFEVLLPMFPGTHVAIHMIGPSISGNIKAQHRSLAMRTFPIPPNLPDKVKQIFNFGVGKPDLVIALNAAVMSYKEWKPCVQMLLEANQKVVFTDGLEQMGDALDSNLPHLGSRLSIKSTPNPFRHPVYQYRADVNLPSWSNGFFFGMGPLNT
ncbi:hypothetical protein BSLG_004904 [Batrachochytrium salamandrivorans]|nr:hypothetical protein BSLG_004904 [Batrachochytrium salamandrivorans]